jgi:hypothetical protein
MSPSYVTEHESQIHCGVDGVALVDVLSWASFEGGDAEAETSQFFPGGLQEAVAQPGPSKRTNVTVKRGLQAADELIKPALDKATGRKRGWVTYTLTDAEGNTIPGTTVSFAGYLKNVLWPNRDAKSGTTAELGLVFEVDAPVTVN